MIIDTHCHFDMMPQPEAYIRQRELAGDIVIGMTNLPSHFQIGQSFLIGYKHVRLALGLHPLRAIEGKKQLALFRQLVNQTSYIGEIGLDFSREGIGTKYDQIIVLREVLTSIRGKKKIVSVHSRSAEKELLELLCEFDIKNVIFHWYSGNEDLIPNILRLGYFFSINEAMTLSSRGQGIISAIPYDRVLTESDAPYNMRSNINQVIIYLSSLWNVGCDEVNVIINQNFKDLLKNLSSNT